MNELISKRFQQGLHQEVIKPLDTSLPNDEKDAPAPVLTPPIQPDILRQQLTDALMPQPKVVVSEQAMPAIELVHFANLYEFAHWYENNMAVFSERQQMPLNTILEARNITLGGCNCDVEKRKLIAEDYFRKFWHENRATDLLPTLQTALKTKKILFGDFLIFPE